MKAWGIIPIVACMAWAGSAWAYRAAIVVDAGDGTVLHEHNATAVVHPASLTKMMTIYLALEAIETGKVKSTEVLAASARAAGQGGARLDLDLGEKISVADAMRAVVTRSANDAAVALAERIGGSEADFAGMMTRKAKALGLTRTTFANATGFTAPNHLTTARDMAMLALALRRDFPRHYALFSSRAFSWHKTTLPTVNGFLVSFPGADGLKTGFTCTAGYNLVASANRDGRRLVGVVLGAPSKGERLTGMQRLLDDGFAAKPGRSRGNVRSLPDGGLAAPPDMKGEICNGSWLKDRMLKSPTVSASGRKTAPTPGGRPTAPAQQTLAGWALDVGISLKEAEARRIAAKALAVLRKDLKGGRVATVVKAGDGVVAYRALIVDVKQEPTISTCLAMRARDEDCLVLDPPMLDGAIEEAERYLRFFAD